MKALLLTLVVTTALAASAPEVAQELPQEAVVEEEPADGAPETPIAFELPVSEPAVPAYQAGGEEAAVEEAEVEPETPQPKRRGWWQRRLD